MVRLNVCAISARDSREATLYVTLEPCSTAGRTAPCTDAIIRAGLKNVVIGATDLNPRHSGRGIVELRNAGVGVRDGILAEECTRLNEAFNKWIVTGQPFVIAKCGVSLDGRLTRPPGEPGGSPDTMLGATHISCAHAWTQCSSERKPSEPTIRV